MSDADGPDEVAGELDRLRARVADLEGFTNRLIHELSTPLVTVHGFASILSESGAPPEMEDALRRMERAAARANDILRLYGDAVNASEIAATGLAEVVHRAALAAREVGPVPPTITNDVAADVRIVASRSEVTRLLRDVMVWLGARGGGGVVAITVSVRAEHPSRTVSVSVASDGPAFGDGERAVIGSDHDGSPSPGTDRLSGAVLAARAQGGRLWEDVESPTGALLLRLPRASS